MVSVISAWLKEIIMIILFAAFLEMLLPTNSLQRFIRVIMGLLIMLAVLNPILNFLHGSQYSNEVAAASMKTNFSAPNVNSNTNPLEYDNLAKDLYRQQLAKQIRAVVMAVDGVADASVSVKADDRTAPGKIQNITVFVKPGNPARLSNGQPILINTQEKSNRVLEAALRQKIVMAVKEIYQLKENQIEVNNWI